MWKYCTHNRQYSNRITTDDTFIMYDSYNNKNSISNMRE